MDKDAVIEALTRLSSAQFVETYLFDCIPWIFQGDRQQYVLWKKELSSRLEVDAACIQLVGSAALGCSLNPHKNFKEFDNASDLDVAIISQHHFAVSWRYLRANNPNKAGLNGLAKAAWHEHKEFHIFNGTIATDRLLGILPFGKQWMTASGHMRIVPPSAGREVKMRIYTDHEALRDYQISSVKKLQSNLEKEKGKGKGKERER